MPQGSTNAIPRHELIAAALQLGVEKPHTLTTEELAEAIQTASESPEAEPQPPPSGAQAGGWFSVAKHLVATVVEQGLNLPQAARAIRLVGASQRSVPRQRAPLPTVTLAQIYIAQGHLERAKMVLEQVRQRQPDNRKAQRLLDELSAGEASESNREASVRSTNEETKSEATHADSSALTEEVASVDTAPPGAAADAQGSAGLALTGAVLAGAVLTRESSRAPERSELVVLLDRKQARVGWRLSAEAEEAALDVGLELLLVTVTPGWDGARVLENRVSVASPRGEHTVAIESNSEVRAALLSDGMTPAEVIAVAAVHRRSEQDELLPSWVPHSGSSFEHLARALVDTASGQ